MMSPMPFCRDGEAGRVVDEQRQRLELRGRAGEVAEILLADLAHAEVLRADARSFGKDTGGELVRGHFEAEEGNRRSGRFRRRDSVLQIAVEPLRRVERNVGRERRLAHARAAGEDEEIGMVESAGLGVDAVKAGGDSGEAAARVERLFGHFHGHARRLGEGLHRSLAAAFLSDPVECRFGGFDLALGIDFLAGVERLLDHLAADLDQSAEQGQLVNLLGEVARPDDRRAAPRQLGEIGGAAKLLHLLVRLEQGTERDGARDHVAIDQAQYLLVNAGVERLEEMLPPQLQLDVLGQAIVDHQRAEQGRFRLHILRQRGRFGR
jgi:hypothetical protein